MTETIDANRIASRDGALDAMAALVSEHGLVALTMSQIAEQASGGRRCTSTSLTARHRDIMSSAVMRRGLLAGAAVTATLVLAACGGAGDFSSGSGMDHGGMATSAAHRRAQRRSTTPMAPSLRT